MIGQSKEKPAAIGGAHEEEGSRGEEISSVSSHPTAPVQSRIPKQPERLKLDFAVQNSLKTQRQADKQGNNDMRSV